MNDYFGGENSPLRESPQFRRYMEEYQFLDAQIAKLQERRGYLSYEDVLELNKLKKLKLATKDEMEKVRKQVLA
jgi:uncharacterized protein YdcH (DUF465 family)